MKNKIKKYYKEILEDRFRNNFILLSIIFFCVDIIFRILNKFPCFSWATLRILFGSLIISLVISSLTSLFRRRWIRNTINIIFAFASSFYAWLQIGFMNYLGVYMSFNTSSQFGAVKDYLKDYLMSFHISYYLIFLPFILYVIYMIYMTKTKEYKYLVLNKKNFEIPFILILFLFMYYGSVNWGFMQNKFQSISNKELFRSVSNPSLAINQFGTNVFGILDIKNYLFPTEQEITVFKKASNSSKREKTDKTRSVSDDLQTIADNDTDTKYISLHNYFLSNEVTDYNEYTGMFEDKNVIVILMESVNNTIINEELFPNFYKLYSEGWHWNNEYSPRNSCATGNNEFSAMTGLYSLYNACTSNVYVDNTYYEAIFNLFNNAGYTTNSMHDFTEWYYKRPTIHTNMGSMTYYNAEALGIETASYYGEWPSDIEFIEKAMDIDLKKKGKWMTWLTTVTTHQPYSSSSTYGDLYKDYYKEMGYSTSMSRYLSKLKVLDDALGVMIDKLEDAGELDDTVIVLLADHYPYGLNKSTVSETIKGDLSDYEIERTPFVIYNSTMEPKEFDEYSTYINLVPTLANLMGIDFDPRLYMGTDLLSEDYESIVVFADGSWKNENVYYNAATGSVKYYKENSYTEEEIRNITNKVSLKIQMSNIAIKNNYFNYLETKLKELNNEKEKTED